MPLYEYECDACGRRFEVIQKFSDPPPEQCTACGQGPVHRQLSSPAIQFKGSGWYITDYARKGKSESGGAPAKSESKGDGKSEGKSDASSSDSAGSKDKGESKAAGAKSSDSKPSSAS